jgi:hypothetical protein
MDALSRMTSVTVDSGLLSRFSMGSRNHEEMVVLNLLFVDDTLIYLFFRLIMDNCRLFLRFEVVSELKINLFKSKIVHVGDVGDVEGLASILGCRVALLMIKVKAPPRIAFLWATALGRIITVDNLRRQGFYLINRCCLCKKDKETINHFLLHCEFSVDIWHLVLISFGVSWVTPSNVPELFHC